MAHLLNTVPGAVGLFSQIDFSISLQFLTRFHCQTRADWLSPKRLSAWLKSVGYSGRIEPTVLYARLTAAPRGATGPAAAANGHVTQALAATLTCLVQQIRMPNDQIATQLAEHADAHIFTSLPAPAPCLPPDCSARSQTAADGSQPGVPGMPGRRRTKHPTVRQTTYRRLPLGRGQTAARRGLRLRWRLPTSQPWDGDLYHKDIQRGHDHPHAVRILACAWLHVIWHCRQATAPTIQPNIEHSSDSSTKTPHRWLDTGHSPLDPHRPEPNGGSYRGDAERLPAP